MAEEISARRDATVTSAADGVDSTSDGSRGPYAKGVARRAQIIESALTEFATRGVDGTSLRTLGDAIGTAHATLRHYFASRDELLVEVYRAHEARGSASRASDANAAAEASASPAPSVAAPDTRGAVELMMESADFNRTIPGLVRLYATLTADAVQENHPSTADFVRARFESVRAGLAQRVREAQDAGRIAADIDPDDAAALVAGASDGLQVQWLLAPDTVDVRRSLMLLERLLPSATPPRSDER
ncbi:MAG TPA: helix-turn-helix domain-containing protein [Microbacterium sp.]|uniref:TetR/AcrR family transcriptional regulator n=1 Tax=Microbacterium sp. TaxID=51671 RepID=UPI002B474D67|nr:helix-turn-helix domain-containing protein [Microbacterium sp.]HKT57266.1 helix-turn-helix domain-containing protein [Microbacterium sp.]